MFYFKKLKKAILILLAFCLSIPMAADAASFSHTHSESCYTEQTATCSNHTISIYKITETKHCNYCLVQQPFWVMAYSDHCIDNLTKDVLLGYCEMCTVCSNFKKNDNVTLKPPHTYLKKVLTCGLTEGNNLASVSISASESGWTSKDVVLTVNVSGIEGGFALAQAPYDFGQGFGASNILTVSSNGSYTVKVKSADGNQVSETYNVTNIDKNPPALSLSKSTSNWTESGLTIYASASDSESGLPADCYSFDGGAYSSNGEIRISSNRTVTVSVRDNAGNVTTEKISISNIGRDPQVIAAEKEKAEREAREKEAKEQAEKEAREKAERERAEREAAIKHQNESLGNTDNNSEGDNLSSKDKADNEKIKTDDSSGKGNIDEEDKDGVIISGEDAGELSGILEVVDTTENVEDDGENYDDGKSDEPDNQLPLVSVSNETVLAEEENEAANGWSGEDIFDVAVLSVGMSLLLLGLFMVFSLNYISIVKNGKSGPVTAVKVKRSDKRAIVYVSEKKLESGCKYRIVFSPLNRLLLKDKNVYVMLKEKETLINTDEGIGFTY